MKIKKMKIEKNPPEILREKYFRGIAALRIFTTLFYYQHRELLRSLWKV